MSILTVKRTSLASFDLLSIVNMHIIIAIVNHCLAYIAITPKTAIVA